jgi:hypothetical protein
MSGEGEADSFLARAQEGMGTRFQSQARIEKANEQRDKDWQAAYARCVSYASKSCTGGRSKEQRGIGRSVLSWWSGGMEGPGELIGPD